MEKDPTFVVSEISPHRTFPRALAVLPPSIVGSPSSADFNGHGLERQYIA